jgi:hypothetical protein
MLHGIGLHLAVFLALLGAGQQASAGKVGPEFLVNTVRAASSA